MLTGEEVWVEEDEEKSWCNAAVNMVQNSGMY